MSGSTAPFIPSIIDDVAMSHHIVDGSLYLGLLFISHQRLLFRDIRWFPVKMQPSSGTINSKFSKLHDRIIFFWINQLMSKVSTSILQLNSLNPIGCSYL